MAKSLNELVHGLFLQGLGQLLVLNVDNKETLLGNISFEKGKLTMRDNGHLRDVKPEIMAPCWESGLMGGVYTSKVKQEWESLTFCGPAHCELPINLSKTRQGALQVAENEFGDNLSTFFGSVYRAYQLMLDNHYLPVVMLKPVKIKTGEFGLGVCDLRAAPIDLNVIRKVNDALRESIARQTELGVEDMDLTSENFGKMFGAYLDEEK
ncbi:MAG: hypothetical protein P8X93_00670 [Gammaproteobacteria bacterium]|jgi:hypothetical protein